MVDERKQRGGDGRREVQRELNERIMELLQSGILVNEIARMLGAGEFLQREGRGPRSGYVFDVSGFLEREKEREVPLNLPLSAAKTGDIILPPDEREVRIGSGTEPFVEKEIIPRTRYLIELFTEMGVQYEVLQGTNSKTMMRKTSYMSFFTPDLEKLVLVCDEEDNASFIVHSLVQGESWNQQIGKTKDEHKEGIPEGQVSRVEWNGDPEAWKEAMRKRLLEGGVVTKKKARMSSLRSKTSSPEK